MNDISVNHSYQSLSLMKNGRGTSRLFALLLISMTGTVFGQHAAAATIGVSDGGIAGYGVSINVPPGIAGIEPKITLQYSASGINGPVGQGWSISGISAIGRCAATRATDGVFGAVTFGDSDKLCLNGERLISTDSAGVPLAAATQDASGVPSEYREYRLEKDTFTRVRAYGIANGSAVNGPAYFKVWTKDGQRLEFGNTEDSRIEVQGRTAIATWAVSRQSDAAGNSIEFMYEEREVAVGSGPTAGALSGKEWNIARIVYTTRAEARGTNRVDFVYVDRADGRQEAYRNGAKTVNVRLLQEIKTYVNQQDADPLFYQSGSVSTNSIPVKSYKLEYDTSGDRSTKRPRLRYIRECSGRDTSKCFPAHEFTYSNGAGEVYIEDTGFNLKAETLYTKNGDYSILSGDFDGDGRTDILRTGNFGSANNDPIANAQYQNFLFFSRPRVTGSPDAENPQVAMEFSRAVNFNLGPTRIYGCTPSPQQISFGETLGPGAYVADFNADGYDDILSSSAGPADSRRYCPAAGVRLYLSRGDGTFEERQLNGMSLPDYYQFVYGVGDNGTTGFVKGEAVSIGDYDGDGLPDILKTKAYERGLPGLGDIAYENVLYRNLGGGNFDTGTTPSVLGDQSWGATLAAQPLYMADYAYGDAYAMRLPKGKSRTTFIDINGDGRADIIRAPGGPITAANVNNYGNGDNQAPTTISRPGPSLFVTQPDGGWYALDMMPTDCQRVAWVDVNGDQLPDLLCMGYTGYVPQTVGDGITYWPNHYPPVLYINTGAGQFKSAQFNLADLKDSTGQYMVSDSSAVLTDVNGDGMTDVVSITKSQAETHVWLSNGDGSFREATNNLTAWKFRQSTPEISYIAGMFTGRGQLEYLRLGDSTSGFNNQLIRKEQALPPDLLIAAKSPSGAQSSVAYRFLSDGLTPAIYESARNTAHASVYPMIDMQPQATVVVALTRDGGIGPSGSARTVTERFKYLGLKAEIGGRGVVGFRETMREFQGPNGDWLTSYKEFSQNFPVVGAAKIASTYFGRIGVFGSTPLTSTNYLYCDTAYKIDADCPEETQGSTLRLIRRPYVRRTIESSVDLSNSALSLPTVTTVNTYDRTFGDWGDVSQVAVTTVGLVDGISQTYSKVNNNTYGAPNTTGDNWTLGRLLRAEVMSSAPDLMLTASKGGAANADAVDGGAALNKPPTVSATVVSNSGTAPAVLVLNADATDSDGTIARVDFSRDGQLIGSDSEAPYTFTWTGAAAGSYAITATAVDNAGAVATSSAVSITVANAPPTATLTGPANGTQVTAPASVPLTVAVSDANGTVTQVQYYANGALIGASTAAPFSVNWANVPAGTYTLYARATDNDGGAKESSSVLLTVNPAMTVTIAPGTINSTQCDFGTISATAAVSVSGGTAPYTYEWQLVSNTGATIARSGAQVVTFSTVIYNNGENWPSSGTAVYRAIVTDADGKSSTKDLSVNLGVVSCQALTVATSIGSNSGTVPATIVFNAAVTSQGFPTKVEFYRDAGVLLGTDTTYPFSFTWANVPTGSYTVYAKAYDNIPSDRTSNSVAVSVANVLPTISISAPADGTVYVAPQGISIAVSAADVGGSVVRVFYYANGNLIGSSTTAPFGFNWVNPAPGSYSISAVVEDNSGASSTSASRNVVVQNAAPTVALNAPLNGAAYTGPATINLAVSAADPNDSVSKVEYFSNGSLVGTTTTSPFGFVMTNVPVGTYSIYAKATDTFGATGTSSTATVQVSAAPNQVPSSGLSLASNSGTAPASVALNFSATDADGTIAKVELYDNGNLAATAYQASGTFQANGVAAGTHLYTAKAIDNAGAGTISSSVSVVVANAPPAVSVYTPANGAKFTAPATIPLSVSTSDANGYVAKVEYFSNGQLLATSTSSPFAYSWTNVAAGTYALKARATDNLGAVTESATSSITVNPAMAVTLSPTSINVSQCSSSFSATSTIGVTGGTAPYTYAWQRISTTGVAITVSGSQTGTFKANIYALGDNPTLTGTSVFRATVTDAAGKVMTKDINVKFTLLTNSCGGGGT